MSEKGKKTDGRKARAVVLTDEQIVQVEALASVLSSEQIADYLGIGRTTFYALMERDQEIAERYKKGRARAVDEVGRGLIEQAKNGNVTAAIFYMKTQGGWREKQEVEVSGPGGGPIQTLDASKLSDAALKELLSARAATDGG